MCMAHPLGHDHKKHDGPSLCEMHRMAAQLPGEHLLAAMDCEHISDATDDFHQAQLNKVAPTIQFVALTVSIFDLLSCASTNPPFIDLPEQNCRSATLLSDLPLRAPPLV